MTLKQINEKSRNSHRSAKCQGKNSRHGKTRTVTPVSDHSNNRDNQIEGFARCLSVFLRRWRVKASHESVLTHLKNTIPPTEVKDLPKYFKLSLATHFSRKMKQDLPQDHQFAYNLFTNRIERCLNRIGLNRPKRLLKLNFDLLQCKSLANEVPREMINEAYRKHAKILSNPINPPPPEVLEDFRQFIQPYLEGLDRILPHTAKAPNKAYLDFPQRKGGLEEGLRHLRCVNAFDYKDIRPRLEPSTMHIEGNPGIGKSLIYAKLGKKFDNYFKLKNSVFWKSSTCAHYDGYEQQPVLGIDDCFYQVSNKHKDLSTTFDLLQLCSTVDYQPPMADLRHKGMRFVTPIILLSSNNGNTHLRMLQEVNNIDAFVRRLDLNFRLRKNHCGYKFTLTPITFENKNSHKMYMAPQSAYSSDTGPVHEGHLNISEDRDIYAFNNLDEITNFLFEKIVRLYESKRDFYLDEFSPLEPVLRQVVNGYSGKYMYEFPKEPPTDVRIVQAYAIPEPLKVRMITKGHPLTWALKPIQLSLFKGLKKFPIFEPCWNPDYTKVFSGTPDRPLLVSGDYSSATDGLCQEFTKIVGEELSKIYPEYSRYIKWGTGNHIVQYPKGADQLDILQTGGQLMGSLLSFPILCLVNAYSLGKVRNQSLSELDCLIHGDDLSFETNETEFNEWKSTAKTFGLEPSIGKNYISTDWYTIDSKIFYKGTHIPNIKWKTLAKPGPEQISLLQEILGRSSTIYFLNETLKRTNRSLDVDLKFGGLARNGAVPNDRLSRVLCAGRGLTRIPKVQKDGLMSILLHDLEDLEELPLESDFFDTVPNPETDLFAEEGKWIKSFSKRESELPRQWEGRLQPLEFENKRVSVKYDHFDYHRVRTNVMNELFTDDQDPWILKRNDLSDTFTEREMEVNTSGSTNSTLLISLETE